MIKMMTENQVEETMPLQEFLRKYRKSEIIFEEGSSGNEMYLIHSGKVELSINRGKAKETVLAVLNPGHFFGEMALVDDYQRSAAAVAIEDDTQLIALDKAKFIFMVRHQPEFALSVMHTLCQRLRDLDKRYSTGGESP